MIMDENLSAVEHVLEMVAAFILIGTVSLFIVKARNIWLEKRIAHYTRKHQHYFSYIAAHLDDDSPLGIPYGSLKPLELKVIQQKLFVWIEQIRGEHRAMLTNLCRRLGLADLHRTRLRSGVPGGKVDAAYNLGVMRCGEAVPELLELLAKEKHTSSLFVIARAVAKCARDVSDLRNMVRLLVARRKQVHELIADILLDSPVNDKPLMLEFLSSEDEDLVKIALTALRGQHDPQVTEVLTPLIEAGDKDVRIIAIQAWVQQSTLTSAEQIAPLFQDDDREIRAEIARAAGELGSPAFVELLKEAVRDDDWRVRYYSARSLAKLDEPGFQALSEVAASAENDRQSADMAQAVLYEEMSRSSLIPSEHTVNKLFGKGEHDA